MSLPSTILLRFAALLVAVWLPLDAADTKGTLQLIFPGAPPRKLIPRHGTRFDVQDLTGVTVEFKQDAAGQVQEVVVYAPDSTFVVPKKK